MTTKPDVVSTAPASAAPAKASSLRFPEHFFQALIWWCTLIMAVLAVPALAILVSMSLPISDAARTLTFVVSCWVCTWLGMWLMRKAQKHS